MTELELKYGCNPNQKPARIFMEEGDLPLKVLNGRPGYINFMDALNLSLIHIYTPFRTKFEKDLSDFHGCSGIGCISDTDPQPLLVRSHLGLYALSLIHI